MGSPRNRARRAVVVLAAAAVAVPLLASPAAAAPTLTTSGPAPAVGALPVDASISSPPDESFPAAPRSANGCVFPAVTGPAGQVIRHVAPCGTVSGNGTGASPWPTVARALADLQPGQVAYLHDDPARPVDYQESGLRPTRDGTGPDSRIRLMAAPGERPWIGKAAAASGSTPLLVLDRPWWLLHGLRFDGTGLALQGVVVRVGTGPATSAHHVVLRRLASRNTAGPKSIVEFNGAKNSALLDSIDPAGAPDPAGFRQPLDADGRPAAVPAPGSGDFTDHHAITVQNGADRILVRNNESYGHNGDSFQCGEETSTTDPSGASIPVTTNVTVEGNRFHQDEENAIDIKACHGVTVRNNKMFGYRPARPQNADGTVSSRAPQGDAVVIHQANSTRAADRVLVELNRFWDDSRAVNVSDRVGRAVVRRNLVFAASVAACGMGAGIDVRGRDVEVYHNTLDGLRPPATTPPSCGTGWSTSQRSALRLGSASTARLVLWNNAVSDAAYPYSASVAVDPSRNLFPAGASGLPAGSVVGDPLWVTDPRNNDYFTRSGSPARDAAAPVAAGVADPRTYCDDPSATEPDTTVEPDIGFLESCT